MRAADATPRAGGRGARRRSRAVLRARSPRRSRRIRSSRSCARRSRASRAARRPVDHRDRAADVAALLSADIAALVGGDHLYFYDAISPIVLAETHRPVEGVPRVALGPEPGSGVGPASRRPSRRRRPGVRRGRRGGRLPELPVHARTSTSAFYAALMAAEKAAAPRVRRGEVLRRLPADRGHGGARRGHAAVRADEAGRPRAIRAPGASRTRSCSCGRTTSPAITYSLVGFQTQMKWGEQARVLRLIPGLEQAEFVRFGMIHRNTYINGPTVLRETWQTRSARRSVLRRADFRRRRLRGVGRVRADRRPQRRRARARRSRSSSPPRTTAIGALAYYVSHADPRTLPADEHHVRHHAAADSRARAAGRPRMSEGARKLAMSERALADLDAGWRRERSASQPDSG